MALRLDQSLPALEDRALVRVRRRAPGLTFDATLAPWWVVGEAAAMERAITNLLDNAAKWSPPEGRVTVRVSAGVLTVDDQGPGIDAEDLPHVFERFYRARESRGMPGSGLGLSIVRQVVARHAGTVASTTARAKAPASPSCCRAPPPRTARAPSAAVRRAADRGPRELLSGPSEP